MKHGVYHRSHREPPIVSALLATHRHILLGPSAAAAAVLLQSELQVTFTVCLH